MKTHSNLLNLVSKENRNTFQALNISTEVFSYIDDNFSVLSIFFDFTNSFETVDHQILLDKMHHYGVRGPTLPWFKDFLN